MRLLKPWLYISLNLGLLPGIALVPDKTPTMDVKAYETALYMQMWANYSREQKEREWANLQPCGNYEQTTGEEAQEETESVVSNGISIQPNNANNTEVMEADMPTDAPVETESQSPTASPLYSVGSQMMAEELQTYLWQKLVDNGIEWFMPYAVLIAKQESDFDIYARNPNGLDCGLFQFRSTYWGEGDIFNPYNQIDVFVGLMANRARAGKTVSEMISAHNMSDYGAYNQEYVNQVMQHAPALQKVR